MRGKIPVICRYKTNETFFYLHTFYLLIHCQLYLEIIVKWSGLSSDRSFLKQDNKLRKFKFVNRDQHRHSTNIGKTIVRSPNHVYHFFQIKNVYLVIFIFEKIVTFKTNYLHSTLKFWTYLVYKMLNTKICFAKLLSLLFYSDSVEYIPSRSINPNAKPITVNSTTILGSTFLCYWHGHNV